MPPLGSHGPQHVSASTGDRMCHTAPSDTAQSVPKCASSRCSGPITVTEPRVGLDLGSQQQWYPVGTCIWHKHWQHRDENWGCADLGWVAASPRVRLQGGSGIWGCQGCWGGYGAAKQQRSAPSGTQRAGTRQQWGGCGVCSRDTSQRRTGASPRPRSISSPMEIPLPSGCLPTEHDLEPIPDTVLGRQPGERGQTYLLRPARPRGGAAWGWGWRGARSTRVSRR